ncbi:MAG: small ribosomal subunit Rsm22 family protein [Verrucomicrobiia bacterium]
MKPTVILPAYPEEIADWWWTQTIQKWPELSEEKILNLIRKEIVVQSDRFNKSRTFDPQAYGSRDLSLLTYGNFFFSRTWKVMTLALSEAFSFREWKKPNKAPIRILDIGSGSGASGLSALYLLRKLNIENSISLESWDYSGKSLSIQKNIHRACYDLWNDSQIKTQRLDLRNEIPHPKKQRFDLILLGYSMNEILQNSELNERVEWMKQILGMLSTSGLILIVDPAEQGVCNQLQETSAYLSTNERDVFIHSPYLNGALCPFFSEKTNYYSHEVRKISSSSRIEKINNPLSLETHEVKFGLTMLSKYPTQTFLANTDFCRLVSPVRKKKGTLSFIGIAADGLEYMYELQRRSLSADETKILSKLERGDILHIKNGVKGKDPKRIRISKFEDISYQFAPRWEKLQISTNALLDSVT